MQHVFLPESYHQVDDHGRETEHLLQCWIILQICMEMTNGPDNGQSFLLCNAIYSGERSITICHWVQMVIILHL